MNRPGRLDMKKLLIVTPILLALIMTGCHGQMTEWPDEGQGATIVEEKIVCEEPEVESGDCHECVKKLGMQTIIAKNVAGADALLNDERFFSSLDRKWGDLEGDRAKIKARLEELLATNVVASMKDLDPKVINQAILSMSTGDKNKDADKVKEIISKVLAVIAGELDGFCFGMVLGAQGESIKYERAESAKGSEAYSRTESTEIMKEPVKIEKSKFPGQFVGRMEFDDDHWASLVISLLRGENMPFEFAAEGNSLLIASSKDLIEILKAADTSPEECSCKPQQTGDLQMMLNGGIAGLMSTSEGDKGLPEAITEPMCLAAFIDGGDPEKEDLNYITYGFSINLLSNPEPVADATMRISWEYVNSLIADVTTAASSGGNKSFSMGSNSMQPGEIRKEVAASALKEGGGNMLVFLKATGKLLGETADKTMEIE